MKRALFQYGSRRAVRIDAPCILPRCRSFRFRAEGIPGSPRWEPIFCAAHGSLDDGCGQRRLSLEMPSDERTTVDGERHG